MAYCIASSNRKAAWKLALHTITATRRTQCPHRVPVSIGAQCFHAHLSVGTGLIVTGANPQNMKNNIEPVKQAMQTVGVYPFRVESCYPDMDAQRNLSGRNHWADPATLKSFKSRILRSGMSDDGLIYWVVESCNSKPYDGKANKRFHAWDVFGSHLVSRDSWHTRTESALKEGMGWLAGFDSVSHTAAALLQRAERESRQAAEVVAILGGAK